MKNYKDYKKGIILYITFNPDSSIYVCIENEKSNGHKSVYYFPNSQYKNNVYNFDTGLSIMITDIFVM